MIRFKCPACNASLKAKEKLGGTKSKCPKCGAALEIPAPPPGWEEAAATAEEAADDDEWAALDDAAPDQHVHDALDHELPKVEAPQRLDHSSRYLICDKSRVFALWDGSGQGWTLKTSAGFVKASRNPEQLPSQGSFVLVELAMETGDGGLRLRGIRCYELAHRWALNTLAQDDHRILSRVIGPGRLTRDQKSAVFQFLRENYMRTVWGEAREVIDFLTNTDYHSSGVEHTSGVE